MKRRILRTLLGVNCRLAGWREIGHYRLNDDALLDMRGFFATLPDNRYKIVLIEEARGDWSSMCTCGVGG